MKVSVTIKLNPEFSKAMARDLQMAMGLTLGELKDDLVTSQTMPNDNGALQGDTFDKKSGKKGNQYFTISDGTEVVGVLTNDLPYARYLYYGLIRHGKEAPYQYHGQINFQTVNNPYARSYWLEPYLDGVFLTEAFNANLKNVREGT